MADESTVRDMLETDRSLIKPLYSQRRPSEAIDLPSHRVEFNHGGERQAGLAHVSLRFCPSERLCFTVDVNSEVGRSNTKANEWAGELKLLDKGVSFPALCVRSECDHAGHKTLHIVPSESVITATQPSDNLATATFHLFNFPDFIGPEDYCITTVEGPHRQMKRCGRVILKADGWNVTIAATDKTADCCKALEEYGGFIITHMGKAERADSSAFSSERLEDLLSCVHCFLSFALGRWAGVALPIGFDQAGQRIFEQWGLPMVASGPWNGSLSWFDRHHGKLLSEVFPGFMALWKDDTWNRTLRAALYWYLGANERATGIGVDVGLILAQTALERLAWTYCVRHRKMVSGAAFEPRGLSAADKLRCLTAALDIPADIPAQLSALHARPGSRWKDGPEAVTTIRNSLVHPKAKQPLASKCLAEAWKLCLWYLDMVLLRLCHHRGSYANRLVSRREGQVEPVPWHHSQGDCQNSSARDLE